MRKFLLKLMLLVSVLSYGQDTKTLLVRDFETWSGINLKYKVNKKWAMALKSQLRLENNSSEISQYFGQFDLKYALSKHFDLVGGFRYIRKNDNSGDVQGYKNRVRYQFDGIYSHKLNDFNFKYRVRYQNRNEVDADENDEAKKAIRFKAGFSYNIKKWKLDPEVSGEVFRSLGEESDQQFEKYRLTIGTSFKVHKAAKVAVFYRFENELNTTNPVAVNILGAKYTYSLK